MKKIARERKDIVFYLKLLPLAIHPGSKEKARAIECRHSIALLEKSFEDQPLPKPDCPAPAIDKNISLAKSLGINGTPTIILPNGAMIMGAVPENVLTARIDQAAKEMQKQKGKKP